GQVYATLFPDRVRRMVMDSVVDPAGVWYADNVHQDYAFQGSIEAFFSWVAKYDETYHLASTAAQVKAAWYKARARLRAHPVNAACAFWPVKGLAKPLQIKGTGLGGIFMLQGTLDPATPYAGAQEAHKLLPSAWMVVVQGGGNHGQSLEQPPNTCVQGYLNAY